MRLPTLLLPFVTGALLSACAAPQSATAPDAATAVPAEASAAAAPQPVLPPATAPSASLNVTAGQGRQPVAVSAAPAVPVQLPAEPAAFARELAESRGLPLATVEAALARASYNPTVVRLMAPPAPPPGVAPRRNWPAYRARFVEPVRIRGGLAFWEQHAATLAEAERTYGVPASVIVAIIGVETVYGRNMGNFSVLDALYTLAFSWPEHARRDRSPYFRQELGEFLAMTLSAGIDPTVPRGSYAGAMGIPQFMPSSIRDYAVATRGGYPDLAGDPRDAIFSVANYLAGHGWQRGHPVFLPVSLPRDPARFANGGLEPTHGWAEIAAAGAQPYALPVRAGLIVGADPSTADDAWTGAPLGVIDLQNSAAGTTEYRVAGSNFYVITKYNRSYFYAASVADLAAELERARGR